MIDLIVETISKMLPFLALSIVFAVLAKGYLIARVKGLDLAEILFSFFRFYSADERQMTTKRRRLVFMRWNNLLNYYIYLIAGICLLFYFITRNAMG
jgi:hypothetical protein